MRLRHLLGASLLCYAGMSGARDVHGVNGYYNWTTAQMQSGVNISLDNNGKKWAQWNPSFGFEGDYLRWILGVNNTALEPAKGGFQFRSGIKFNEQVSGAGFMTMRPEYPVFVCKMSIPRQSEAAQPGNSNTWISFRWNNPYTGKVNDPMPNDGGGGFWGFKEKLDVVKSHCPWSKDALGRDSIYLYNAAREDSTLSIRINDKGTSPTPQKGDTVWYMKRLPVTEDQERCEILVAINFASILDSSSVALPSRRLIDRVPIRLSEFTVNCISRSDTMYVETDENGDTIFSRAKTRDELPYMEVKWLKTFPSMDAVVKSLTAENNWGDGEKADPQKDVLNTALYEAEKIIKGFQNYMGDADEAYAALKEVHAKADGVYNKADATTEEYLSAIEEVNAAVAEFYSYVNPAEDLVYNYIRTSDGSVSLYALSDEVTKDSYTGRPLALGANESAMPLTFVPVGEDNGLVTYNLKGKDGVVVQCTDGTLLLVNGASDAASFTFADRDGFGLFDMQCGSYYYYKSGYELKTVDEFPDTDYEGMQPYLFQIEDALSSYVPSDDEKTGLFEAWEFNGEAEDDPGTKGTINGAELVMGEHGQTFMLDGWRMQRWRMWSRVNKDTYKDAEGEDLQCLKLTAADTYDSFDGTSLGNVTTYPTSPSMRREGGVFTNFYDRDPEGGVRDESCMISLNPGVRRYIAMKCKGTNPEITVDKFNFLQQVNGLNSDFALNLSDAEMKGDVYYWDLLRYVSVGKTNYVSQYMSTQGFQQGDALYIDWIRTYETVDDIPSESFATGVRDVQSDGGDLKVFVTGRTINVFTAEAGGIYTVDGTRVAAFEGTAHETVRPGIYIVRAGVAVKKVIVR
ncbi:hypothetical protein [Paraprevotella xylaniphila]|uniref:hypothetical protein n=1 Tax=Paraprevotella xylaniphila TaxID=454155 RepID=UPI002666A455|nr:hypothetical protein [Paraprevotella xylaniphila]